MAEGEKGNGRKEGRGIGSEELRVTCLSSIYRLYSHDMIQYVSVMLSQMGMGRQTGNGKVDSEG